MKKHINIDESTLKNLPPKEKEDLGLLILMQQVDIEAIVSKKEFFKALNEK